MKKIKILVCVILISMITALFGGCIAKVPVPEVEEGRFDFSVTYEVNGEIKTYTGVYVCEYDGVYTTCAGGGIEWRESIENEEGMDIAILSNDECEVYLNFGFFPEYFMGAPEAADYDVPSPKLYVIYYGDDSDMTSSEIEEVVFARYGIKIISYQYAAPIENKFEEKLKMGSFEPSIN